MRIAVLGSGYVGWFFSPTDDELLRTSRRIERGGQGGWAIFDSCREETWEGLHRFAPEGVVATFPLRGLEPEERLARFLLSLTRRLVCIGTTSALLPRNGVVDDDSPIQSENPRALAEEEWRRRGATILHSAGIYGPGRNPLDWLRRGRITNAGKLVNLVHGEDLARACRFLLEHFSPAVRLVISDGRAKPWREIIAFAVQRGYLSDPGLADRPDPAAKRIIPRRLPARGFTLAHPDLFAELDGLEGAGKPD